MLCGCCIHRVIIWTYVLVGAFTKAHTHTYVSTAAAAARNRVSCVARPSFSLSTCIPTSTANREK